MRLILIARERELADTVRWQFRSHPVIEVVHGEFEHLQFFDCIATAGNSFGLMDAGIDKAVVKYFGEIIQQRIQERILADYLGEQPIGTCIIVPTGKPKHPFVAHTPTMRIPMNIAGTDYVYLAMWATLLEVRRHNRHHESKIESLVCPVFGAGSGGVDFIEATLQLRLAYEHFIIPPKVLNPSFAQMRHERIHYGGRYGYENKRK
jgi:O-acetyl-ADP-ribose deacetylase (regulator of RNase III)